MPKKLSGGGEVTKRKWNPVTHQWEGGNVGSFTAPNTETPDDRVARKMTNIITGKKKVCAPGTKYCDNVGACRKVCPKGTKEGIQQAERDCTGYCRRTGQEASGFIPAKRDAKGKVITPGKCVCRGEYKKSMGDILSFDKNDTKKQETKCQNQ